MAVILIVEDNSLIRQIAEMMIQDWSHQTLSASDVGEALSLLRSPRHIDALFTDIYLKTEVLAGVNLHTRQSSFGRNCVFSTRQAISVTEKMKAQFAEGTRFLRKPYSPDQLQNSVEELLAA
jgi:CheY-like chemotaxis protein